MTQHTPGPWTVEDYHRLEGRRVTSNEGVVADVWATRNGIRGANARLIAAAPRMLEALKAVVGVYEYNDDAPLYARRARALLKEIGG